MAILHEDIFGGGKAIEIIVRWHDILITDFNRSNTTTIEQIKSLLKDVEYKAYFLKVNDKEQKIVIPFEAEGFQLDLVVVWDAQTFSYKAAVKSKKKSKIVQPIALPQDSKYYIEEVCKLIFIDQNESRFPIIEQKNLYERINNLEIAPIAKLENDREIWYKWIEAQDLLLQRNAQPFKVRKYHHPVEFNNEKGITTKYKFKVDLEVKESREYKEVEEELLNEFSIKETFDKEGNIFLKFDDIYRGLDAVIHKKFNQIIEREKSIGAILKLKPISISTRFKNVFKALNYDIDCKTVEIEKKERKTVLLEVTANKVPFETLQSYFDSQNYELKEVVGEFLVLCNSDVLESKRNELLEKGQVLPKPSNNVFKITTENEEDLAVFNWTLKKIFGKNKVRIRKKYYYQKKRVESENKVVSKFTEEFWNDIKRDLYFLDFNVVVNTLSDTISFDFETNEEFFEKFKKIREINKFDFSLSPTDPEFKFKVKTNLVKTKTEKQVLQDRIHELANVEFLIDTSKSEKNNSYLSIGKLNAYESDTTSLTFSLALRGKEDKKIVDKLLDYLEDNKPIREVFPNLKGDQAKTNWLKQAMAKIVAPTDRPNGKSVNPRLGEFIFDSSKSEEIFKDVTPQSEEWEAIRKNELLQLNDSQRKAILAALHARDLCLLQGPPGTGKTTVIAELIWQMISKNQNQKILLTSETNLAVDNALEKLLNKDHTLVKPLRFGKDTKFEEEGKKYSINRIMKWLDDNFVPVEFEDDSLEENDEEEELIQNNPYNNAIQIWMNRIAEKSHQKSNHKYEAALKDWAFELSQPTASVKRLFKDKYFKYANVIGSTCSSSGSNDFAKSYQFIFNTKEAFKIDAGDKRNWINVEFDTVIMDEASKATPPEMLLPLCFGKKSIVIGDHRQLPPMLNEKEFKEALLELNTERALKLAEEIDKDFVETSQFERLILNPKVPKSIAARLNIQYRMQPKINNVIKQFYTGETDEGLEPAQELITHADSEDLSNPFSRYHGLINQGFIKPDVHTIWINVDEPEELVSTSRVNEKGVEAVKRALTYLKNAEGFEEYFNHFNSIKDEDKRLQEQEIGIISFYGQQLKKLIDVKKYAQKDLNIPIRLKTVDKFQGMERNIVIVSTVRSNKILKAGLIEKNHDIGFAKAPERLNVALSRARRLLIVVGNLKFFESYKDKNGNAIYKNSIEIIRQEGLIIDDYKKLNKYNA